MSARASFVSFTIQTYESLLRDIAKRVKKGEEFNRQLLEKVINDNIKKLQGYE